MQALETWLAAHPEWRKAGDFRSLYYNGPYVRNADKWAEIQIPVQRAPQPAKEAPARLVWV